MFSNSKAFLFVIFLCIVGAANAQTAEEIIEKHLEAIGGGDPGDVFRTLQITGMTKSQDTEIPTVMKYKREGGKMLMTFKTEGKTISQGFDGIKGWMLNPFQGDEATLLPDDKARELGRTLKSGLYGYKVRGETASLEKTRWDGIDYFKIVLKAKDGSKKDYYISTRTFYVDILITEVKQGEEKMQIKNIYSDYRDIGNGVMQAYSTEIQSNGTVLSTYTISSVKTNKKIADKVFSMPTKK